MTAAGETAALTASEAAATAMARPKGDKETFDTLPTREQNYQTSTSGAWVGRGDGAPTQYPFQCINTAMCMERRTN